jgi:hypothetical protein
MVGESSQINSIRVHGLTRYCVAPLDLVRRRRRNHRELVKPRAFLVTECRENNVDVFVNGVQ